MKHKGTKLLAMLFAFALIAAACGDSEGTSSETTAGAADTTAAPADTTEAPATTAAEPADTTAAPADTTEPPAAKEFEGTTVNIFSSIRDVEAERLEAAWASFEEETGIDIVHEPSSEFETQIRVRVEGGNSPDLAFIPQPGLLSSLVATGSVVPLASLESYVAGNHLGGWVDLGSVDGTFYAPPFGTNVKSFVWYNPGQFAANGYEVPTTWGDMIALSDQMVADGFKPWCAGIESGGATGWPATDWIEDTVLRFAGADVYDQWVSHEIPFNDPQIAAAVDEAGAILRNDDYMLGGARSVAITSFQDGGLGILDGSCFMHRQASFYGNQFPDGTTKGADGDVNAFYFPVVNEGDPQVMLGGGEVIAAFTDRPEVVAVAAYLTSTEYANNRLAAGNWLSPNTGVDTTLLADPLERLFADTLLASEIFRFDGSDMMPGEVGAGTFWTEMTSWIGSGKSTADVLDAIEASWPTG